MDMYWICSECGSANKYPDLKECEVCGKEIDSSEITAAKLKSEQIERQVSQEKKVAKRKTIYIPSVKTVQTKIDKDNSPSNNVKNTLPKKKKKKIHKYSKTAINNALGILAGMLSLGCVIGIIYITILLSHHGKVPGGWIFFIINSILSLVVSAVCFLGFHEEMQKEYFFIVPSGIVGAMAISATITDLWIGMTSSLKEGGLLSIIFSGWLMFIVFILVSALTIVISIIVTQIFPSFLMGKTKQKYIGGFLGLIISIIAGYIYIRYFEMDGLNYLLGASFY